MGEHREIVLRDSVGESEALVELKLARDIKDNK